MFYVLTIATLPLQSFPTRHLGSFASFDAPAPAFIQPTRRTVLHGTRRWPVTIEIDDTTVGGTHDETYHRGRCGWWCEVSRCLALQCRQL